MVRILVSVSVLLATLVMLAGAGSIGGLRPGEAAFPGLNGKISFYTGGIGAEIYVMNADGSGLTNVTNNPAQDGAPAWSPDGSKIAFSSGRDGDLDIWTMNADGTGVTNMTDAPGHDTLPAWSPDGSRMAFAGSREGNEEVYVMNADGSGQTNLTHTPLQNELGPAWSPDGAKIAFDNGSDIYVMNADGSGKINLTANSGAFNIEPAWSPGGASVVFASTRDNPDSTDIYLMKADGTAVTRLTDDPALEFDPAWSPDGVNIVFVSNRDNWGDYAIYVMKADGTAQTRLTDPSLAVFGTFGPDWQPVQRLDADITVSSFLTGCPGTTAANAAFKCTVFAAVHNNGPTSSVGARGAVNVGFPRDCSVQDYTAEGQGFGAFLLRASVSQAVSRQFQITCSEDGPHQSVACATVELDDPLVIDPNPYNDFASSSTIVTIGDGGGDPDPYNNFASGSTVVTIGDGGGELHTAGRCTVLDPPEVCGDGIDNDNDGLIDEEPDMDGDGVSDCVDGDDDGDGFSDEVEAALGTDPLSACPIVAGAHAAWPPDFNDDRSVDLNDVLALKPVYGASVPVASPRYDLDPSGAIDIGDVLALKPLFGASCAP